MKAYDEVRTTNPDNAYSNDIEIAFDKANRYDDMRQNIIGLRNSAWAAIQKNDYASSSALYYSMNALLESDTEVLLLMRYPVV